MTWRPLAAMFLAGFSCLAQAAVAPVPESEQAARALIIIDTYQGARPPMPPKKLHIVYFTPADRQPAERYEERLDAILEDIRSFYRAGMDRCGFGPKTFTLDRDDQGSLKVHLVRGSESEADFPRWEGRNGGNTGAPQGGDMVKRECQPVLEKAGISLERETVLIFCHLAKYDDTAGTFRHHSPYFGIMSQAGGLCFAADWAQQDLANLTRKEPKLKDGEYGDMSLGKHTTIFIGGIAHELGHAFGLPHCGERWDEAALGTSIMGLGNHTYREELRGEGKGSFLTMASAMRLASRPLFDGSAKAERMRPELQRCTLSLSTNITLTNLVARRGALRVEGMVVGDPPVYGVIAYFDSMNDGGSPYLAPAATTVPDAEGRFAIEVSDLKPCKAGEVRVEFCHANGAVSERKLDFAITSEQAVDLTRWQTREALEAISSAVAGNDRQAAQIALLEIQKSSVPALAKEIAPKLASTLDQERKLQPVKVPERVTMLPLGDAQPETAEVGWLKPAANRVPVNQEVHSPLLDSGGLYATGLYAHSPSRYVFDLGGKWSRLRGEAGLHTHHQGHAYGVVFVIKTDGKEVFRSRAVRTAGKPQYDVDLTGVKTLELIVEKAGHQNGGNWGLWLGPTLFRTAPSLGAKQRAQKS